MIARKVDILITNATGMASRHHSAANASRLRSFPTFNQDAKATRRKGTHSKSTNEESVNMVTSQEEPAELSREGLLIEYQNIIHTWVPSKSGGSFSLHINFEESQEGTEYVGRCLGQN